MAGFGGVWRPKRGKKIMCVVFFCGLVWFGGVRKGFGGGCWGCRRKVVWWSRSEDPLGCAVAAQKQVLWFNLGGHQVGRFELGYGAPAYKNGADRQWYLRGHVFPEGSHS